MNPIQFSLQKGAFSIRGSDLDTNFRGLQPLPSNQYGVNQTEAGWTLDIFPPVPEQATEPLIYGVVNGELGWYPLEVIEEPPPQETGEEDQPPPGPDPDNPAPDPDDPPALGAPIMAMYFGDTEEQKVNQYQFVPLSQYLSTVNESTEEGSGHEENVSAFEKFLDAYTETTGREWAIRTVERCDGKRMDLFGTDWYDPA